MSKNDVAQRFQHAGRISYACFLCDKVSGPQSLWKHFQEEHRDVLGNVSSGQEDEIKKRYLQDAQTVGQNDASREAVAARWRSDFPIKDVIRKPDFVTQQSSNIIDAITNDSELKDIKGLSLEQKKEIEIQNPLKRPPDEHDGEGFTRDAAQAVPAPLRMRHSQNSNPDEKKGTKARYQRGDDAIGDGARREPEITHKLFNPDVDQPPVKPAPRRGKHQSSRHRHQPSAADRRTASSAYNLRNRKGGFSESGKHSRPTEDTISPVLSSNIAPKASNIRIKNRRDGHDDQVAKTNDVTEDSEVETEPKLFKQPDTRPISHDQLVVEVKGIYAGLVLVEAKCIDVDERQSQLALEKGPSERKLLKDDQWQSLITLHKQLLHEHHDFFLASQHPSASINLRKLAAKYSMPARMWRHAIHAFLEVLRHRLPESLEHMLTFIYIAYSMMALLYETVTFFEDTWIECLGDLGRYRMAIEDDEPRDREVWSGVARYWYSKASDRNPRVGRLYHHLAILARPFTLEQLSFYTRALTCVTPFASARGSIMTLFNPALIGKDVVFQRVHPLEHLVIQAHALLFVEKPFDEYLSAVSRIEDGVLDRYIEQSGTKLKQTGTYLVVSLIASTFDFGTLTKKGFPRSALQRAYISNQVSELASSEEADASAMEDDKMTGQEQPLQLNQGKVNLPDIDEKDADTSKFISEKASDLAFMCFRKILKRQHWEQGNILAAVHVWLIYVWSVARIEEAIVLLEPRIPWASICAYANFLLEKHGAGTAEIWNASFPMTAKINGRPPPEDYITRGQLYTRDFFPRGWFVTTVDEEERFLEQPSHNEYRRLRVLWLMARISTLDRWIRYNSSTQKFEINSTNIPAATAENTRQIQTDNPIVIDRKRDGDEELIGDASFPQMKMFSHDTEPSSKKYEPSNGMQLSEIPTKLDRHEYYKADPALISPATPEAGLAQEIRDIPMVDSSPPQESSFPSKDFTSVKEDVFWSKSRGDSPSPVVRKAAKVFEMGEVRVHPGDDNAPLIGDEFE